MKNAYVFLFLRAKEWRFAYAKQEGERHAVVSSARMTRRAQANPATIRKVHSGLRKMVTKTIGMLYYNKSTNSNPKSVLYDNVLGLGDLDNIDEDTLCLDILGVREI